MHVRGGGRIGTEHRMEARALLKAQGLRHITGSPGRVKHIL